MSYDSGTGVGEWAWEMGRNFLADQLPDRWSHSLRALAQALSLTGIVAPSEQAHLATAVLLHDIGYSPQLARTGFHPLDGALFLQAMDVDHQVVRLVANHSCATTEAELRGLTQEMKRFPLHFDPVAVDAMIWCDMTSGPTGDRVDIDWRLANITNRYGPESLVSRFIAAAESELRAAAARIEQLTAPKISEE